MKQTKRLKPILRAAMLLLLCALPLTVSAYEFMVDGIAYFRNYGTTSVTVTSGGDYSGEIIIPEEVSYNGTTYSVTHIGDHAFGGCTEMTSVTIPNSVTYIDEGAFAYCSGLTSLSIPSSVTHIRSCLFWGDGVEGSFIGCSNLETITVDSGNTTFDSRNNCNAIIETATNSLIAGCKNTTIPSSVKHIGDGAFYGSGLTSVTIPNSITEIGDGAFSNCSELTSMTISNSITYIGFGAFAECSSLSRLTLIGQGAFTDTYSTEHGIDFPNDQIKTLNIGSGITAVGGYGFTPEVVNCYAATPPLAQVTHSGTTTGRCMCLRLH